jgi:hypothetical protein
MVRVEITHRQRGDELKTKVTFQFEETKKMKIVKTVSMILLLVILLAGCAGIPVRRAVKVDMSVPVGKVEGSQFIGVRYPFKVSAPPNWKVTTEYPKFMMELGFEEEGLKESEVFIFNPATQSNLQIDFTPAGRYSRFNQKTIEWITAAAAGSFKNELEKEFGKEVRVVISSTEPYSLKGVPYAAETVATYYRKEMKTEHGWVYAFAEPYQIFIIYMVLEKEGMNDHQDIKTILDSFEVVPKQ